MTRVKSNTYKKASRTKVARDLPTKGGKKASTEDTTEVLPPSNQLPAIPAERNLMQVYMQEVAKAPLLSAEEEYKLALKVFNEKDREAFQKLVQSNLRFVLKIAFEYVKYGAKVLDLVQEGNVGLIKAVQEFNPYKDVRLTTYAVWWIRSYIQDYLLRNWSIVRVGTTAAQKKLFYNLKKEIEKFEREGLKAMPKAIAMNLGVDEEDVKVMQERFAGGDVSLSSPVGDDNSESAQTLISKFADPTPLQQNKLEENEQSILFKKALEEFKTQLNDREIVILNERLLSENPRTLLEIGEEYGITKERARQLEENIKKKLKEFLATKYPDISLN